MFLPKFNYSRLDAAENVFFQRELEQKLAKSYDVKYAELKSLQFVPMEPGIDAGAEQVTYEQWDRVGMAKLISSYAEDFPRADVKAKQFSQTIKSYGSSFGYSVQDIRAARLANKPLEERKMMASRRALAEQLDTVLATGDTLAGSTGLLNQSAAQTFTVPNGAAGSQLWSNKTQLERLADLNGIARLIVTQTSEIEIPTTIVLPTAQYAMIAEAPLQAGSDTSALDYFLAHSPYIKEVTSWTKLVGAGAAVTDRMLCYKRDPETLSAYVPVMFEQFPPEQRKMAFEIACHMRTGGVVAHYPMAIAYGDGI